MKDFDILLTMEDKIHPTKVLNLNPSKELGKEIIALRYNLIIPILEGMLEETKRQENGDRSRGRIKLANELEKLYQTISQVKSSTENLITICKPYIEKEKARELQAF